MSDNQSPPLAGVRYLQELQQTFDRARGFDCLGRVGRPSPDCAGIGSQLGQAEFAVLALCGELGEVANLIKKARRADCLGESFAAYLDEIRSELSDVFAYLLKLANVLAVGLDELYLEKMSQNHLRFPARRNDADGGRVLTIAGPPCVGKTTIAERLKAEFPTYVEDTATNAHLRKLLAGEPGFDGRANQDWFLSQQEEFIGRADPRQHLILDQDPVFIIQVYARIFREKPAGETGKIEPADYVAFLLRLLRLETVLDRWPRGRTVLFLDASAAVLRDRFIKRELPRTPELSWFEDLRQRFKVLRQQLPNAVVVSTEGLDADAVTAAARELLLA